MVDNKEETFKELKDRLAKSGEWDKIMRILIQRLNERGFLDSMRDQAKEKARAMEKLNFAELMSEMLPLATANVSPEVKNEVMSLLQGFFQREIQ